MTLVGGCVMLPVPLSESKVLAGSPVRPEQLAFLVPGRTTREEVVKHLGQPGIVWEDMHVYVYRWDMRQGVLLWAAGGMSGGATAGGAGMTDIPKHYLLLLQVDGTGQLLRFERTVRPLMQSLPDFLVDWSAKSSTQTGQSPGDIRGDR